MRKNNGGWLFLQERKYFRLFFVFTIFLNTLNLSFWGMESNPLYPILFVWAVLLLVYDLWNQRLFYPKSSLGLLLVFSLLLIRATLANQSYSNAQSYELLILQIMIFLFVFANPKSFSLWEMKQELRVLLSFTTILTLIASSVSLVQFFLNVSITRNGVTMGLVGDRLFGVYFNCNPAAFLACIMLVIAGIALHCRYRHSFLYWSNIVVQLLYIILTGCRAALLIVILLCLAFLYYYLFRRKTYSFLGKTFLSLLVVVTIFFGSSTLKNALYHIPQWQGAVVMEENRFQMDKIFEILRLIQEKKSSNLRRIYELSNEVSSGRLELLHTAYQVFRSNPVQGVGVGNFQRMGIDRNPNDTVIKQRQVVHTHNAFVESAVVGGIFGFLLFVFFFLRSSATIWQVLQHYQGSRSYFIVLCFFLIVLSDFIGGMFDYGVFYSYSLSTTLAWLFLGYLDWLATQPTLNLTSESKDFDFAYYHLCQIHYDRKDNDSLKQLKIILVSSYYSKDWYVLRIDIALFFSDEISHFIYDASFHVECKDEKRLQQQHHRMCLEMYEMVKNDIEHILSDGDKLLLLPQGNKNLIAQK